MTKQEKKQMLDELEDIRDELYAILMTGKRLTIGQKLRDREDALLLRKKELEERLEDAADVG